MLKMRLTIEEANHLGYEEFVSKFGNTIEHCPMIAAAAWAERPFTYVDDIHSAVCRIIDSFSLSVQEGILRCHPDLAGRLAATGALSSESTNEQKTAGLLDATESEKATIQHSNQLYKDKFGFPFVICVRENKKEAIMNGMVERLRHDRESEVRMGIGEVKKIGYLRLCDVVDEKSGAKL